MDGKVIYHRTNSSYKKYAMLPDISLPPTKLDVVKTVDMALKVAEDCNEECMLVTYDLSKLVMTVQNRVYRVTNSSLVLVYFRSKWPISQLLVTS